jgi:hypothetical protein
MINCKAGKNKVILFPDSEVNKNRRRERLEGYISSISHFNFLMISSALKGSTFNVYSLREVRSFSFTFSLSFLTEQYSALALNAMNSSTSEISAGIGLSSIASHG